MGWTIIKWIDLAEGSVQLWNFVNPRLLSKQGVSWSAERMSTVEEGLCAIFSPDLHISSQAHEKS
jgi:hypothetical protein